MGTALPWSSRGRRMEASWVTSWADDGRCPVPDPVLAHAGGGPIVHAALPAPGAAPVRPPRYLLAPWCRPQHDLDRPGRFATRCRPGGAVRCSVQRGQSSPRRQLGCPAVGDASRTLPCRSRASEQSPSIEACGVRLSATIACFSSSDQRRRRSPRVIASIRCGRCGSVAGMRAPIKCAVAPVLSMSVVMAATARQIMRRYRNAGSAQRLHLIHEARRRCSTTFPRNCEDRVVRRPRYGCRSCEEAIVQAAGAGASH